MVLAAYDPATAKGNTAGGAASNVYLQNIYEGQYARIAVGGTLTGKLGVTIGGRDGNSSFVSAPGVFAEAYVDAEDATKNYNNGELTGDDLACFKSDAAGYAIGPTAEGKAELYKPATDVTLSEALLDLTYGGSKTLIATVEPDDATHQSVTWASSAEGIATVDASGKVTAVSPGTATITATADDKTATCTVTVSPKSITPTVTLSATSYSYDGTAKKPSVTVNGGNTPLTSSDYTVSYANNTDPGTATATVTLKGNYTGTATAKFQIYGVKGAWSGSSLKATAHVAEPANALLIAAVYDKSGKQESVKVVNLKAGQTVYETGVTAKASGYTYKLMVVSKSTYAPLCKAWSEKKA
ncbi:MAG: Ig domain-containing protein [Ruminococcaceae bacterium]|nr:Ig domain-containing protein [Oscillospiraceae bacterium]